jgi:hypothetical protein
LIISVKPSALVERKSTNDIRNLELNMKEIVIIYIVEFPTHKIH